MENRPSAQVLSDLIQLQDLDSEISTSESKISKLPERRAKLEERVATASQNIEIERKALEEAELEQRRTEGQLRDSEALVKRLEGQTANVSSNQAYTALLNEIEHAQAIGSNLETKILELLEAVDTRRSALAAAESRLVEMERHAKTEAVELDEMQAELTARAEKARVQRNTLAAGVEKEPLALYTSISRRYTVRIAVLADKACTGCRMVIPSQRCREITNATALATCPQCDRIIVTEARMEEAHAEIAGP